MKYIEETGSVHEIQNFHFLFNYITRFPENQSESRIVQLIGNRFVCLIALVMAFSIQSCRSCYATQHLCQRSFYKIFAQVLVDRTLPPFS
jgi:hypothetical protein